MYCSLPPWSPLLTVPRPNGVRFTSVAATTEFCKRWNPKPGDIVSFKHSGFLLRSRKPKLASIYRLRPDLSWEDVVHKFKERIPSVAGSKTLGDTEQSLILSVALSLTKPLTPRKPNGYWNESANVRRFFLAYAAKESFDPLISENWLHVRRSHIRNRVNREPTERLH